MKTTTMKTIAKRTKKANSIVLAAALAICFTFPINAFSQHTFDTSLFATSPTQTGEGNTQTSRGVTLASEIQVAIFNALGINTNISNGFTKDRLLGIFKVSPD